MEGYFGSGLSTSQLLQALNKVVDGSIAETRWCGRCCLNLFSHRQILTYLPVQDDLKHERGSPFYSISNLALELTVFLDQVPSDGGLEIPYSHEGACERTQSNQLPPTGSPIHHPHVLARRLSRGPNQGHPHLQVLACRSHCLPESLERRQEW